MSLIFQLENTLWVQVPLWAPSVREYFLKKTASKLVSEQTSSSRPTFGWNIWHLSTSSPTISGTLPQVSKSITVSQNGWRGKILLWLLQLNSIILGTLDSRVNSDRISWMLVLPKISLWMIVFQQLRIRSLLSTTTWSLALCEVLALRSVFTAPSLLKLVTLRMKLLKY
jgi:hypothetical protein